jgi:lipoprotein NlpD
LPARALGAALLALVIAGCAGNKTRAPIDDMNQSSPSSSQTTSQPAAVAGTYTVKAGDTLYSIARAHGVSVAELTSLNSLADGNQLRIGQVLRLNDAAAQTVAVSAPVDTGVKPAQPTEPVEPARPSDATLVSWGWPAQGRVLQGFSANSKGLDIDGKEGEPVVAAAAGKVMYVGNGVRGLGNLVLLDHGNNFMTAYAHNQKLLVTTGQVVKKGDRIALLGMTDTTSPRLHFEIRRSGTPVNPVSYLPPR